jgi:DNA-binding NarL/FixJ family response regulator
VTTLIATVRRYGCVAVAATTRTILIVDDHPSFRTIARLTLEAEGFVVVGDAANGEAAVAEAARLDPDVVLLDVGLPDIDGFEVAARLRAAGARSAIVFTSTRDASDFGPLLAGSGAQGFIAKAELSGESIRALVA